MEKLIVDRIVEGKAACEAPDRSIRVLDLSELPPNVREGDCLEIDDRGEYVIDHEETRRRRKHNIDLLQKLMSGDDKQV